MTITNIVNSIYFRTKTNVDSFLAADMLIFINAAYDRVVSLINHADSKWQWDDENQTDLPSATAALVSGQADYSFAVTHLSIDRVEVRATSSGSWHLLTQIDRTQITKESLTEYQLTDGLPNEYDLIGTSVILYPAPNYAQSASLKIYFTRGGALFTAAEVTTGTKVPGFVSLFHDLIPLWVSYEYAVANGQGTASGFFVEIQRKENELIEFYGKRNRSLRPRLTVSTNGEEGTQSGRIGRYGGDSNE